jgi:hypothetical protein
MPPQNNFMMMSPGAGYGGGNAPQFNQFGGAQQNNGMMNM